MTECWCPTCRDVVLVEQPPCPDGHGECPEWVCLSCESVLVLGWFADDAPVALRSELPGAA